MLEDDKKWFEKSRSQILNDFFRFLRFKTISADPAYRSEMSACVDWLKDYLSKMGMQVEIWKTKNHSIIFAASLISKDAPTVLIYHHYDVQPVDPLDLWTSPPFEPAVRDGQVYARGAQDNKGQCFYTLTALKAFFERLQKQKINIKLFIEGEEEMGSEGVFEIAKSRANQLKADYLLVVDNDLPKAGVPGLTLGLRGILTMEFICRNSSTDLHSGMLGGIALNPNRALIQALSQLWDKNGRVAVPHFYDGIEELDEKSRALLDFTFDKQNAEVFGIKAFAPEPGYSLLESNWIRPTVEINGIKGGYAGEGFKTVIPAEASAKISCRLVPGQDPEKIHKEMELFLKKVLPKEIEMKLIYLHGAEAFRSDAHSLIAKTCAKSYEEVMKKPCRYSLSGGSIPIVGELADASGADTVLMGFGLGEDNIHAPNEHFGLDRLEQGFLTMGRILNQLNE